MPARSIYAELKSEHKELKELFKQLGEAKGARRKKLFDEVVTEMTSHARAEEKVLYEKTAKPKETREATMEGYQEHHVADLVATELRREDHKTDEWKAKAGVLREIVEHHMSEEEKELFPKARKVLSDAQAKEMIEPFEDEKQRVAQTLH